MKKILFLLSIAFSTASFAQNEVKFNIANTIAIASVEVGYERFLDEHQSVEFIASINDRINYHSEAGSREFNTNSFALGYNYYFGNDGSGSGIYANPFIKYRSGDFTQEVNVVENEIETTVTEETDMNSFIIGLGGGYKWNFNDTFVMGPFINIGRNFSDEVKERFSAIEFNAGFYVGYRF